MPNSAIATAAPAQSETRQRLALVFLSTYAVLLIAAGLTQITDPFMHYDDYPALLLDPEGYYSKTLSEGRWFSYLWHLRGIETPATVNYQLYFIGWALFVSAAALNIFRTAQLKYPALLAALLVVGPQTTLISGWFNSLIPGMWLLAFYGVTALFISPRANLLMLFLMVPIALQAYTPYPFLMLAILLLRQDQTRSLGTLLGTMLVFAASFAVGILVIYSLNYAFHGVFGLALADWRDPNPATGLAGYVANLSKVAESLAWTYAMSGFGKPALSAILATAFLASLAVIGQKNPAEVLYVLTGIAAGLGLLSLHTLMEGILFPFRSTYFLWFLVAIALMRAVFLLETDGKRKTSAPLALAAIMAVSLGSMVRVHNQSFAAWQVETRDLAARISSAAPEVFIYGSYLTLNGYGESRAQMPRDLQFRLGHLTGIPTRMCTEAPAECANAAPPFDPPRTGDALLVVNEPRGTFIRLPVTDEPVGAGQTR